MLGIYIHIPFCLKKCSYCDFVSIERPEMIDAYFAALKKEIELTGRMYTRKVDSIFFGGGTPSFPEARYLVDILEALRKNYTIEDDAEITMEANPCSLTAHKLKIYREAGINRLSIGMQAAQDSLLKTLGRQHTGGQFDTAFGLAREAGFSNINIDAIYAVSGQEMSEWRETLQSMLEKDPEHISAYAMKIEEGTPLAHAVRAGELSLVDEDTDAEMYHMAQAILKENGYVNYEVSNFAKEGYECAHNLKYWNVRDYLGLGTAAHSCVDHLRFANTEDVEEYIAQMKTGNMRYTSTELIGEQERKLEYIMLKLRLKSGFTFFDYKSRFNEDFREVFHEELMEALRFGLIEADDRGLRPTEKGFDLQNRLVSILIQNLS